MFWCNARSCKLDKRAQGGEMQGITKNRKYMIIKRVEELGYVRGKDGG